MLKTATEITDSLFILLSPKTVHKNLSGLFALSKKWCGPDKAFALDKDKQWEEAKVITKDILSIMILYWTVRKN